MTLEVQPFVQDISSDDICRQLDTLIKMNMLLLMHDYTDRNQ